MHSSKLCYVRKRLLKIPNFLWTLCRDNAEGWRLIWTFVIFKSSPLTGVGCKYEWPEPGWRQIQKAISLVRSFLTIVILTRYFIQKKIFFWTSWPSKDDILIRKIKSKEIMLTDHLGGQGRFRRLRSDLYWWQVSLSC